MRKFLILQTRIEDEVSDNEFDAFVKYSGLDKQYFDRLRMEKNGIDKKIDLNNYSGIILGGGPLCVSSKDKSPQEIKMETDLYTLLDEIVEKDFPFLGACLGIGILGNHQGCIISKEKYGEDVGGVDIVKIEEGKKDVLLRGLDDEFRAFVGHKEACQVLSTMQFYWQVQKLVQ